MISRLHSALIIILFLMLQGCAPSFQKSGVHQANPVLNATSVQMGDGTRLRLKKWQAEKTDIVLLGVHGFNDHAGAFEAVGEWMRTRGVTTYAYDQRGFGANKPRGIWAPSSVLAQDLRIVAQLVKQKHPLKPLYIVGLSMGGAVTIKAYAQALPTQIEGVILAAPAVWGWRAMNPFLQSGLWLSAHTVPWYSATGEGLGKQASDNIPMLRALGKDPLFIKETRIDAVYGLVGLMDEAYDLAPKLRVPSLYLYGSKDEIVPPDPSKKVMASMTGSQHRKVIYKDGWHMLLRDNQAKRVFADILTWMKNRQAGLPSGAEITQAQLVKSGK